MNNVRKAAAAVIVAAGSLAAWSMSAAEAADEGQRYHGWGLAIAYLAVGEKCPGALASGDMESLQSFIASGLAYSRRMDTKFDHDKFVDTFHDEMVAKYSDARNCTPAVVKEARDAVAAVRKRESEAN